MCTVSWIHESGGYQVLCNRDEKLGRAPAAGPHLLTRDGVSFIAPIDGQSGGTWIGVNEYGVSVCLLNGAPLRSGTDYTSRGRLVLELTSARSVLGVCQRLGRAVLTRFAPCTIAALERSGHTAVMEWDGWRKTWIPDADSRLPLCSSSFDPESVAESRRREFARILEGSGVSGIGHLLAFHRSHAPQRGPYSTCMHRADAETVSFTWVSVTASEISLYYAPGAPCRSVAGWSETMALAPEESTGCLVCC